MDFSAPHIDFVIVSYLVSALVLGGLAAVTLYKNRAARRRLDSINHRRGARAQTVSNRKSDD